LPYSLEFAPKCLKKLGKMGRKNPEFRKAAEGKILDSPHSFKPLRAPLQNKRRVHLMKSFVLVYEVIEAEKKVRVLEIRRHDDVYRL